MFAVSEVKCVYVCMYVCMYVCELLTKVNDYTMYCRNVCMYVCMYEDSDGLLSVSELRAVLAGFFLEHCHRAIREDAAGLSAALSAAMDPQKSGYIATDGIHTYIYIHT